jgi:two-component system sensor histidine kinase ChiS
LHFSITDSGIGIPEEEIEAIFSPFTQSSKTKTKAGGTGLGLAIAKEIVEAHHGKIWARANNGPGATFEFLLPKLQSKQMDGHMIVAENEVQIRRTPISNKPATILVVDDEETCLVSMELLFRGTNYKLIKVTGGHAAINYLKENPTVDLIMLDLMMPDMYGLNVLAEVKQNPLLVNIPVILQSGTSDTTEIEKAYQMGISCYIKKPYQKWVVLAEVEKLLA